MATGQTWVQDIPYILSGGITVPAGKTFTVKAGAVIKSDSIAQPAVTVQGRFDVQGTSSNPVYFTAINDDSAMGDTNNDGSSTGTVGLWGSIKLENNSTSTIQNAIISYGGEVGTFGYTDVYVDGGYLSATSTIFASSSFYGVQMASGTVKITTSTFKGNQTYGIYLGRIGSFTVTTSSLTDNGNVSVNSGAGYVDFTNLGSFTSSGNTSTRNTRNGFIVFGSLGANSTWTNDLPYVIQSGAFTVASGKTLTMNPGTVVKFEGTQAQLVVDGTLNVKGTTSTNPIYFTSLYDDSVGGDTNNDTTTTSALAGDWQSIQLDSGSSSTLNYAVVRYGGHFWVPTSANIYMGGGKLT
jgi:hypothetical protein